MIDLATNSLTGDHRIDYLCLATSAGSAYFAYLLRRLTRRIRAGTLPKRTTRGTWVQAAPSTGASFAFTAVVGYLVGGWVAAVVLASATTGLSTAVIAIGTRRRRRARAVRPS